MIDTIITAGIVVTVDPDGAVITDGAVAIDGGAIVAVGTASDVSGHYDARKVIAKPSGVMLPGLVDAHSHAGHGLIRTMGDDLDGWMDACQRVYLHGATPDTWYIEGRLTAAERLLAGTTTSLSMLGGAGDTVRADNAEHGLAHARAYSEIGLRTLVVVGPGAPPFPKVTTSYDTNGLPTTVSSSFADQLDTVETLGRLLEADPFALLGTTFPTLTPVQGRADGVRDAAEQLRGIADKQTLAIVQDGHRAETVEASAELGLLGPRTVLSHATDLTDDHIALIAESGTSIAHNPSAIFSQYGRCPVPELQAAGVTVGLGSDATAPDRSADMFRHMFQLTRYHRAMRRDPSLFQPEIAIQMATIDAATSLGLAGQIGSLEVGKRADIVIVDADKPHLTPLTDPVRQIVYFATGADVDTVLVDGVVRMKNRSTAVPLEEVLRSARDEQRAAFERAEVPLPVRD